jgi:hypothetical protein
MTELEYNRWQEMKRSVEFYLANGYRVMPLYGVQEGCKHPVVMVDEIKKDCMGQCWGKVPIFEHWPDSDFTVDDFKPGDNIALIMGKQHDGRWLVGLDIDGDLNLDEWMILPKTLTCRTNRGIHLIFEVNEDTPLGNWNDALSTRSELLGYKWGYTGALDIKYCRGAMTSPPSMTKIGTQYKWDEWMHPAILTPDVIDLLIRKRKWSHPKVKRFRKWTLYPTHKGQRP